MACINTTTSMQELNSEMDIHLQWSRITAADIEMNVWVWLANIQSTLCSFYFIMCDNLVSMLFLLSFLHTFHFFNKKNVFLLVIAFRTCQWFAYLQLWPDGFPVAKSVKPHETTPPPAQASFLGHCLVVLEIYSEKSSVSASQVQTRKNQGWPGIRLTQQNGCNYTGSGVCERVQEREQAGGGAAAA